MNKKPTLSISLLSCGNEPHIEDCLKGIAALREWMKVEIVVVDTSPEKSEDVRRVIKKYADKIVDFDWCDDFSAARNVGLQKCRGEWFMFVDDDEVLQNADSIANFFGSGDYRKYNTASIIIRNLGDEKGTKHFDQWAPRLYRKPKNAHFEGLVHEHFVPADYPLKALDAVVRHYGYVFETKKDLLDHIARNTRLLEKEIEEQPNDITARIHYLQEHVRKQDFIAQKRIALDCLARLEGMGGRQNSIYRGLCQGLIMRADRVEGRSGEALERFRSLMPAEDYLPVARAYFFKEAAKACVESGKEREARDNAGEYLSLYDGMKDKLDLHSDELSFHLGSTFDEDELEYLQRIASGTTEDGKYKRYVSAQVESRVMDISFSDWREGTDEFLASSSAQEIASRYLSLKTGELHADVRYDYYYARTDEGMLSAFARQYRDFLPKDEKDIEAVYDNFRKRFSGFCKNTIDYYETYRYFFSESEMAELMPRLRLASELAQVVLLEALDAKAVLGAIRSMIGTYTEFDPVLNYYAHLYGEYWKLKLSSGGIAYKENLFEYDVRLWKLAEKGKSYFPALIEAIDAAWWQGCVDQLAGSDNERNILSFLGIFDSYGENGNAVNYAKRQLRQRTIEISAEHYRKGEPVFVCRTLYGRDSLIIEEVFGFNDFIEEQMRLFEADIRAIMEQK